MIQTCTELLQAYRQRRRVLKAEKLTFLGISGRDVYNIAAPICVGDGLFQPGKAGDRILEVMFSGRRAAWVPEDIVSELQDRFGSGSRSHLSRSRSVPIYPAGCCCRIKFLWQDPSEALAELIMKDIRAELPPVSRSHPQGEIGIAPSAIPRSATDELSEVILQAELLPQFIPEEWGGANEVHVLKDGRLGVLGHIARFDEEGARHYFAMAFEYDPECQHAGPMQIIAVREDFPPGDSKRPDLKDVIFPGGLVRQRDGTAWLYAGLSDSEAGRVLIPDPFRHFGRMGSKEMCSWQSPSKTLRKN